ncbi:hypothetical protein BDW42DRAFT_195802 [Aspergillus taichungensis]|uniref:Rhodopsin domain-containing protein n=1 Tax=Aspergillus taichungensis TaxID=482145 RepID=A0A2J5HMT7_9EURO|nr:hypothetical protein BDW42DRAFT_195802 [Aspergillus taichungensis]
MATGTTQPIASQLSPDGLIAVTWIGVGLGVLFVSIRLAIRLSRLKRLYPDDYFVLVALAFLITNAVLQTLQTPHLYYTALTPRGPEIADHAVLYKKYEFAIIGIFWSVLWSIKGSFLALFWMITQGLPRYIWAWWVVAGFVVSSYIVCWLLSALNCHPPSEYFKLGGCGQPIDKHTSFISICFSTAVDIATDVMIMGIGVTIVCGTRINRRERLSLGVIFSLGIIIVAAAVVRAIQISGKAYTDMAGVAIWSVAESSISVIIGCLPPFKIFLSRHPSFAPYTSGSAGPYLQSGASSTPAKPHVWSDTPPPQRRLYQNLDFELHSRNTDIVGGAGARVNRNATLPRESVDSGRPGEIRMVKEFSVITTR